jgi:HEAT repeat protein
MGTAWRAWMLTLLVALLGAGGAAAQAQNDVVLGKTSAEWLRILREHKEARFRRASLIALEALGPQRHVVSGLYEALEKDPEPQVRREVAQLLGRFGPEAKGASLALAAALKSDPAGPVREAAAAALGGKLLEFAQGHVPTLAATLKDPYPGARAAAAEALKNLGERARPAMPALAETARDVKEEKHTRIYALQALSRWSQEMPEMPAVLVEVLSDKDSSINVRQAAAEGLARLGCGTAGCLAALSQALGDKAPELRLSAAAALTTLGARAKDAWPVIEVGLKDADSGLRYQLIRAAGTLAQLRPEAIAALAERAQRDESTENRLAAIQELGEAGAAARSAEAILTQIATQDARARLREAAAAALKRIKRT